MKTISREAESAIEIKRSRFIGRSFKAATPDEALAIVKRVRETWRDATHHCWAYRVGTTGEQARYDNSGEPQGTAGPPILDVLKHLDLTNTLVVVTRYYGGTKLGAVFPWRAGTNLVQIEPSALVVGGVHPEHAGEDGGGFVEAIQAPEAEAVAVQAAEVRAVVDHGPPQDAGKVRTEGQLADPAADIVVAEGHFRPAVEFEVAQVGMGILRSHMPSSVNLRGVRFRAARSNRVPVMSADRYGWPA